VNDESVVERRLLRASRAVGNDWLVTEGLKPGDRVVLEGFQRIRAGARVNATERARAGG
jgi:multidrug efflux pump subunit AcrA (membrane-fusion protein)